MVLWRAVHWLFEVASKRKWGRKSIIDFAFCLTQTLRTEKHIRSLGVGSGVAPFLVCEPEGNGEKVKEVEGEEEHQTTLMYLSLESYAQSSPSHHCWSPFSK